MCPFLSDWFIFLHRNGSCIISADPIFYFWAVRQYYLGFNFASGSLLCKYFLYVFEKICCFCISHHHSIVTAGVSQLVTWMVSMCLLVAVFIGWSLVFGHIFACLCFSLSFMLIIKNHHHPIPLSLLSSLSLSLFWLSITFWNQTQMYLFLTPSFSQL